MDYRHAGSVYFCQQCVAEHPDGGFRAGFAVVANGGGISETSDDRGRSGLWALLVVLAWMLLAGNWSMLPSMLPWVVGRLIPTVIFVMLIVDLGAFVGTQGENKYGKDTIEVKYR